MMLSLIALLAGSASAQSLAELVDGSPEFLESCLEDPDDSGCSDRFYRFLTSSMVAQGFTFQQVPQLSSPLVNRVSGLNLGVMLDTFPFSPAPENLAGKPENTKYSPVLPRLVAGWTGGEGTRLGAGVFALPPVPIQGASALVAGADAGAAWDLGATTVGVEGDVTFTRARAPIVASEEQYANREDYGNNLKEETYEAVCAPAPDGCIDVFTVMSPSLRAGASWTFGDLTPSVRLGGTYVNQRLYVMYDDTTWRVRGLQLSAHLGAALALSEQLHLSLGTSYAWRPAAISESEQAGLLFKAQGAAGWIF